MNKKIVTLDGLADQWAERARRAFADAETEVSPMGKRLIEHGATCYANCAFELREALSPSPPDLSELPSARQT